MKNKVFILLGGNVGDVQDTFKKCIDKINLQVGQCVNMSEVYISEPWGFKSENLFYNQALFVETTLNPSELLKHLLFLEKLFGRERDKEKKGFSSRKLDIDILFFNDLILDSEDLSIPHSFLHKRRFALRPMLDIAPVLVHPVYNKTIMQLFTDCKDNSYVNSVKDHNPEIAIPVRL
ncbi:MAG: 2-amino-4-hydroxy-6-hydroxymethyldihydropteridine diphosphokinase [Bacteroidales bacterium]